MDGYKLAINEDGMRVVVYLSIPNDALTNIYRKSVRVKQSAKYRTNKARIVRIEGTDGTCYLFAWSAFSDKQMLYAAGGILEDDNFDTDPDTVCSGGIHFFLDKRVAELYGLTKISTGLFQKWYDNGYLHRQLNFTEGCGDGICSEWYNNGQLSYEGNYVRGEEHGAVRKWYRNGMLKCEWNYKNGVEDGVFRRWSDAGELEGETRYKNGKLVR